jgi:hypothetical protein
VHADNHDVCIWIELVVQGHSIIRYHRIGGTFFMYTCNLALWAELLTQLEIYFGADR